MSTELEKMFDKAKLWIVSIIAPAIGLLITGVIFVIRADDKLGTISNRQDKQDTVIEGLKTDIGGVKTKVDTIERRQAIYQATHK